MSLTVNNFLVIDQGNTAIKFGVFKNQTSFFGRGWFELKKIIEENNVQHAILSNVAASELQEEIKKLLPRVLFLNPNMKIPLNNLYATPNTLGSDRLANAVAINQLKQSGSALCIDIGTCLKFDFVNEEGSYLGGSISPGMRMRFKSLHDYTKKLPLINKWDTTQLIGNDTASSIVSGVVEGMSNEINQTIHRYSMQYSELTIFLTGGDYAYFENAINYRIFADPNLTLHGLKIILEANV